MTPASANPATWSVGLLHRPAAAGGPPDTGNLIAGASLSGLARSAARTLRDCGAAAVMHNALAITGIRRVVIFHRRTDLRPDDARTPPDITVDVVTEDSLDAYGTLRPDTPGAEARRRLGMTLAPGRGELLGVVGTITLGRRLIVTSNVPGGYMADPLAL